MLTQENDDKESSILDDSMSDVGDEGDSSSYV